VWNIDPGLHKVGEQASQEMAFVYWNLRIYLSKQ
jgi:hypothetical protein